MTIKKLKEALREVAKICTARTTCEGCPFAAASLNDCPMREDLCPEGWPVWAWEDEK